MLRSPNSDKKKIAPRLVAALIIIAAIVLCWAYWQYRVSAPLADDAMLQADVVNISTPVPGRVERFYITENSRVKSGDLLFTLDPTTYRLRVEQAEAELRVAEAALEAREREIHAERSNASVASEQIVRAKANLQLAEQTLERLLPLARKGYVTAQQVDDARALSHDAQVSLKQALAQAEAADSLIGTLDAARALVDVNRSSLALAKRALADTEVRAPHDGLIVGLTVSSGEYVAPDQSLFTLINTERWYAVGFFRETELSHIHPGTCALVYAMADPNVAIRGIVDSIGWGIASVDLIDLPRALPIVQKSLNWVRVAQRFPVRVELEDAPESLLRVGASAVVVIQHDKDC